MITSNSFIPSVTMFISSAIAFSIYSRRVSMRSRSSYLNIVVLGSDVDKDCLSVLSQLPREAKVVAKGPDLSTLLSQDPNCLDAECLFVASGTTKAVGDVIKAMTKLKWIQVLFAGLDHMRCPEFDK